MLKFDVMILGAGVAGCAVAAVLARSGKRVMITDPAARPGGSAVAVELQGLRVSGWSSCGYGFEEGGAWNGLLRDLDMHIAVRSEAASYQVALPGRRMTIFPDFEETLGELRREYPGEFAAVNRFYRDIGALRNRISRSRVSAYLAHRRKAEGFLRSYRFSKELLSFFSVVSYVFFGRTVQDISLSELVTMVSSPPRRLAGGYDKLAEDLCEVVARHGGECRFGEPWPEVLVRRSRIVGVQAAGNRIDLDTVVLNVPWQRRDRTFLSVVRDEVIPVGMLDTVLVATDYDHAEEAAMLSLDTPISAGRSASGLRSLRASFSHIAAADEAPSDVIDKISQVIPFLKEFTESSVIRDGVERTIPIPDYDVRRPTRAVDPGGLARRLAMRTIYVLEDISFGTVGQAHAARAIAGQLV